MPGLSFFLSRRCFWKTCLLALSSEWPSFYSSSCHSFKPVIDHQVASCRFPCLWCHLAEYHQQWLTSRDRMKVWLIADGWQDMQLLSKWPILQRKTAVTMPQREAATFFLVNQISFICWSKPWWACDMRRLCKKKKNLVWSQRVFVDKVGLVQTHSLTKEVKLLSG